MTSSRVNLTSYDLVCNFYNTVPPYDPQLYTLLSCALKCNTNNEIKSIIDDSTSQQILITDSNSNIENNPYSLSPGTNIYNPNSENGDYLPGNGILINAQYLDPIIVQNFLEDLVIGGTTIYSLRFYTTTTFGGKNFIGNFCSVFTDEYQVDLLDQTILTITKIVPGVTERTIPKTIITIPNVSNILKNKESKINNNPSNNKKTSQILVPLLLSGTFILWIYSKRKYTKCNKNVKQ